MELCTTFMLGEWLILWAAKTFTTEHIERTEFFYRTFACTVLRLRRKERGSAHIVPMSFGRMKYLLAERSEDTIFVRT